MTPSSRSSARQFHYSRYPEFIKLLSEVQSYKQAPARWLDVGAGSGAFLDECRHAGYYVEGVEVSLASASEAERSGLLIHKTLDDVSGEFDVISMWHVLEHLLTPRATLQTLRAMLRPDGLLCIRVPNFGGRWAKMLADRWVWFQPSQHIVHFSTASLSRLVTDAGFDILEMRNQRPNSIMVRRAYTLAARVFNTYAKTQHETATARFLRLLKDITAEELFVIARPRR